MSGCSRWFHGFSIRSPIMLATGVPSNEKCRTIWKRCVRAKYMTSVRRCQHCQYGKMCNNLFCVSCSEGGLCAGQFLKGGAHDHHPWLEVLWMGNRQVVHAREVYNFLGFRALRVHVYFINHIEVCNLNTTQWNSREGKKIVNPSDTTCRGCDSSMGDIESTSCDVVVCSIECLIKLAESKKDLEYLGLREQLNLSEPYVYPMTVWEKIDNIKNLVRLHPNFYPLGIVNTDTDAKIGNDSGFGVRVGHDGAVALEVNDCISAAHWMIVDDESEVGPQRVVMDERSRRDWLRHRRLLQARIPSTSQVPSSSSSPL